MKFRGLIKGVSQAALSGKSLHVYVNLPSWCVGVCGKITCAKCGWRARQPPSSGARSELAECRGTAKSNGIKSVKFLRDKENSLPRIAGMYIVGILWWTDMRAGLRG